MSWFVAVAVGALAALLLDALFRRAGVARGRELWAWSLLVAALVYVGFAAAGGASRAWFTIEVLGVSAYAPFVVLGLRGSARALAAGWALHVVWDLLLHSTGATPFVPILYPPLCIGFDMLAAGFMLTNYAPAGRGDE